MRLPARLRNLFEPRRQSFANAAKATTPGCFGELLGRQTINLDTPELQRFLAGKTILVSGAGGSIGSEICRQTMKFCPERLILLDRAEHALFEIDQELRHRWVGSRIEPMVGDICDEARIEQILAATRPHVIFHAAAHKHVPMMEANPGEAVKNNVFGTKILADAAAAFGVDAFVMISSDKAVNPSSVMGATKRMAELYVQSMNRGMPRHAVDQQAEDQQVEGHGSDWFPTASLSIAPPSPALTRFSPLPAVPTTLRTTSHQPTRFVAVRFGNVLGSSGSVVPIFQKQIEAGGPVTVTHAEMKRYFMTIPEASQLVMQAGAIARGGEVFVLDMGEAVRIIDLAHEMIRRAGLRVGQDIELRVTGVRPGEKLYEELARHDEETRPTSHDKIRVWQLPEAHPATVRHMLDRLGPTIDGTRQDVVRALRDCIPEYEPGEQPSQADPTSQAQHAAVAA